MQCKSMGNDALESNKARRLMTFEVGILLLFTHIPNNNRKKRSIAQEK